jgi:alpha-amylase
MKKDLLKLLIIVFALTTLNSCRFVTYTDDAKKKVYAVTTSVEHEDWTESAVIYEVNIRQYTPEGTINAFVEQLPKLKAMGVNILWLMPIFPIGEKNRKGSLGSYYSVKDYMAVNPELGTMEDIDNLIKEAHGLDMYVILDWVANHTAWDNPLMDQHPDWYKKDSLGKILSPYDWTDVAQLNYDNKELRNYMVDAMKFWVEEEDVDGFRCDVAGLVPCDFWDSARISLSETKSIFMLAEDESNNCLVEKAFDMNYSWELYHIMNNIAKGTMTATDLKTYFQKEDSIYDPSVYRMNFTSNHDENSWNGTEFERLGDAAKVFALLTFTVPGMPLIYTGQETGLDKRLRFFDKDTINWTEDSKWADLYTKFIKMKDKHRVLWNGAYGGTMKVLEVKGSKHVFAFERKGEDENVVVLMNFSGKKVEFNLKSRKLTGNYYDYFEKKAPDLEETLKLPPYGYMVLFEEI